MIIDLGAKIEKPHSSALPFLIKASLTSIRLKMIQVSEEKKNMPHHRTIATVMTTSSPVATTLVKATIDGIVRRFYSGRH